MDFLSRNETYEFEEMPSLYKFWKNLICSILRKLKKKIEFFRILKCVTERECVTSRVRKYVRGYCTLIYSWIRTLFQHESVYLTGSAYLRSKKYQAKRKLFFKQNFWTKMRTQRVECT